MCATSGTRMPAQASILGLFDLRMLQLSVDFHNAAPTTRLGGINHAYKRHSTCMAYTAFSYTVHGKVRSVQSPDISSGY